jgi:hypothetical protein
MCGREHSAASWNIKYCHECRKAVVQDLRAHYDAVYLAAVTGLSSLDGETMQSVSVGAHGVAIASLRNRNAALAERDAAIDELLG